MVRELTDEDKRKKRRRRLTEEEARLFGLIGEELLIDDEEEPEETELPEAVSLKLDEQPTLRQEPGQPFPEFDYAETVNRLFPELGIEGVIEVAERQPQSFLKRLVQRGTILEQEAILRGMGASAQEQRQFILEGIVQNNFPDTNITQVVDYAEKDPELFVTMMRQAGADGQKILDMLGVDEDTRHLIMGTRSRDVRFLPLETQTLWDRIGGFLSGNVSKPLTFGARRAFEGTRDFVLRTVPNLLFPDEPVTSEEQRKQAQVEFDRNIDAGMSRRDALRIYNEKVKTSTRPAAMAERINAENRANRDRFRQAYIQAQEQDEQFYKKNPDLLKPEYEDGKSHFDDVGWYIYTMAKNAPITIGALAAGLGTAVATKNPLAGMAAAAGVFTPISIQDVTDDLILAGVPEQQAALMATPIGLIISALESVGEIPILRATSPVLVGVLKREITKEVGKLTAQQLAKRGVTTFTQQEIAEIATEVFQQAIQNAAVRVFDKTRAITENLGQTAIQTGVATLPFAFAGGASSFISANEATAIREELSNKTQIALKDVFQTTKGLVTGTEATVPGKKVSKPSPAIGQAERERLELVQKDKARIEKGIKEGTIPKAIGNKQLESVNMELANLERQLVPKELPKGQIPEAIVPIPKAEVGMPEAGLQPSMIPEEVAGKEVRPKGKGRITQIAMDEQLKLEETRRAGMIEGLEAELQENRANDLTSLIEKSGKMRGEFDTLTIAQYRKLTGKETVKPNILTADGKHVKWEYALDEVATERGFESGDALRDAVLRAKELRDKITVLKSGRSLSEVELGIPEEEIEAEVPPPSGPPPPQTVVPPAPQPAQPVGPRDAEIKRIVAQSEEQVRQNRPGVLTRRLGLRIPGIKQLLSFERPGLKMTGGNERVLTSMVAENAARSDVSVWSMSNRLKLFREIRQAFGKDALHGAKVEGVKFLGTAEQAENPITGTIKDIADNPELYQLSNEQEGVLASIEIHNNQLLDWVTEKYGAEIGKFTPKEGGAFLPNVDVSEDVVEYLGSETRAAASGRGKTRIWATARERMVGKTPFKPELDIEKLIDGLDSFKASAAGGQTYRAAIGGLTRLEAMQKTHPALYDRMTALRKRLSSLQGSAGTIESNVHSAIFEFLNSPVEDTDLANLRDRLDVKLKAGIRKGMNVKLKAGIRKGMNVKLKAGIRKGMNVKAIQNEIASVRDEIKELRPAWKVANLKPYVFVQEGIFRYFPSDTAKLIQESRKTTNNIALNLIEKWRGGAFSGDVSPFAIQGVIGVLADPWGSLKVGVGGVKSAIEHHDLLRSVKVEALADDISANPVEWGEYASLMGRRLTGTPQEYAAGFLSKIPGFDKFTESTYVTVTRGSFNLWQRSYKHMMASGIPELQAKVASASVATKVYPLVNTPLLGQSQSRAALLRAMPTSYSFIRQPASLMAQAVKGMGKLATGQKLTAQESLAVKMVVTGAATTLTVSAISAALSAMAQGKDDDKVLKAMWDAINPNPNNGKFASIIIGDKRIPLGGPYRAIFRALYLAKVKGIPFPVPGAGIPNYLYNRITPSIRTQLDLWRNRDYTKREILKGEPVEKFLRALVYEFQGALPLTAGEIVERLRQGENYKESLWQQVIAQFMGVNMVMLDNTYLDRQIRQLGLPQEMEAKPYTINEPKLYLTKDLWGDAGSVLKQRVSEQGYDDNPKIKAIIEGRHIKEQVDSLPNVKPVSVNANPAEGDTFIEYFQQWQERSKIKDEKALVEFDKQYPQAYLGNFSQADYVLLRKYHGLTDKKAQADFLKENPELSLNPREEWLRSHPEENAKLAIWGQAKVFTQQAYDKAQSLIKTLDIPDDALDKYLPPKGVAKPYFDFQDTAEKWGSNSWEAKLMLAKNDKLREYLEREKVDTPVKILELKVKNRGLFDKLEGLADKDSPDYIEDEKKRAEVLKKLKKDNPKFVDDLHRIEAYDNGAQSAQDIIDRSKQAHVDLLKPENQPVPLSEEGIKAQKEQMQRYDFISIVLKDMAGGKKNQADIDKATGYIQENITSDESVLQSIEASGKPPTDFPTYNYVKPHVEELKYVLGILQGKPDIAEKWVERGKLGDEHEGFNAEDKLWLVDNPDVHKWALTQKLLTDEGKDWNVPVLRIDVKYRKEDAEYDALPTDGPARDDYLNKNETYRKDRRRREAYGLSNSKTGYEFPTTQVENFVAYNELSIKGKRRDRFLVENPEFAAALSAAGRLADIPDPAKVPAVQFDDIYDQFSDQFDEIEGNGKPESKWFEPDPIKRAARERELRFAPTGKYTAFRLAEIRRDAYGKFVPGNYINDYVGYYTIIGEGKPKDYERRYGTNAWYEDDWFLMENLDFYREVYVKLLGNERRDFRKVPSRNVFRKYLEYLGLPEGKSRDDARWRHPDLDEWLVLAFDLKPIAEKKRRTELTPRDKFNEDLQEIINRIRDYPKLIKER